jgi:hypothetical protein
MLVDAARIVSLSDYIQVQYKILCALTERAARLHALILIQRVSDYRIMY